MRVGGVGRLATLALLWGSSFLWIKLSLRGLSPVQISFVRLVLGAGLLATLVLVRGLRRAVPRGRDIWGSLVVAALIGNATPFFLFAAGEQQVDSSIAGVLNATTPLWTFAVAVSIGHERRVSPVRATGLVLGFAGTVLIFAPWSSGSQVTSWGGLACLGAAASYGISYVYLDRRLARSGVPPLVLSACQLTVATGYLALLTPVAGRQAVDVRADALVAVVVLGLLGTGAAYVLNYRMIAEDGATTASTVTYLLPVVAVVLGVAFLDERLTVNVMAGTAVVLTGVALARRSASRVPAALTPGPQ